MGDDREQDWHGVVGQLRQRIAAVERGGGQSRLGGGAPLGAAVVDRALPGGGLARGALHEVAARNESGQEGSAAAGFAAWLAARLATGGGEGGSGNGGAMGPVLWCQHTTLSGETGHLYGPGLAAFGLDPSRLLVVVARRDREVLWVMEEGLRCPGLAAVLGEIGALDLSAARRLQLAAETSGVTALLLRPGHRGLSASAAVTRWRVAAAPSTVAAAHGGLGAARWDADLWYCRGGRPRRWLLEWDDETGTVAVAATLVDGQAGVDRQAGADRQAEVRRRAG